MKITKRQLQQIIKEELTECMSDMGMMPGMAPAPAVQVVDIDGRGEEQYEGRMAKGNLYNMAKHATMLHNLIQDNEDLEPWLEEKIAVAADAIETVAQYMEYEKMRGR
jgi:hypothetical protein